VGKNVIFAPGAGTRCGGTQVPTRRQLKRIHRRWRLNVSRQPL